MYFVHFMYHLHKHSIQRKQYPLLNHVHFSGEKYSIFTCLFHLLRCFSSFHSILTFLHTVLLPHMNMNYQKCILIHTHLIFQECKIQKEECIWLSCILFFSYSSSYSYLLSKDTHITLTRYSAQHYIFGKFVSSLISSMQYKEIIIFPVLLAPFFFIAQTFYVKHSVRQAERATSGRLAAQQQCSMHQLS